MDDMRIDRLIRSIEEKANPSALGLDTRIEYVPESFAAQHGGGASAVRAFNFALLDALKDIVSCVKIQAACYELMGVDGIQCLADTMAEARRLSYTVILDAKRGDIGSTAEAYSGAYLGPDAPMPADFMTVNPYFGIDGVKPFIDDCGRTGRGIFILVKTSNPSSGEFQDIMTDTGGLYGDIALLFVRVGNKVSKWGEALMGQEGYSSVGAVVGATYPEQGAMLRNRMPHTFFLLPGYGAQGATAEALRGCFDSRGRGAVVNASRSIICAHRKAGTDDFVSAARDEAIRMRDELRKVISIG